MSGHKELLREAGLRVTNQRISVLDTLTERDDAVTAQDLYLEFRRQGESIGLSTVYRTLTSLVDAGLLDTFQRGGEQAFRACSPKHHHHLVCTTCNQVTELEAGLVEEWVGKVAETYDFAVTSHKADIYGTCTACQAA
jgi:Fur family transcriptional regulator, ferric uptake regulator